MKSLKLRLGEIAALALLSTGLAVPAQASSIQGQVVNVTVRSSDGLHYVIVNGTRSAKPACATKEYFMIADEHSDAGKAQLAMLLSAYMGGKTVIVIGTGACTRWGDGEDILAVTLG